MKKILAYINDEERDKSVYYSALYETYMTLLKIDSYDINKEKVTCLMLELQEEIANFWDRLLEKYKIPYYVDKKMSIDVTGNYIYVET